MVTEEWDMLLEGPPSFAKARPARRARFISCSGRDDHRQGANAQSNGSQSRRLLERHSQVIEKRLIFGSPGRNLIRRRIIKADFRFPREDERISPAPWRQR